MALESALELALAGTDREDALLKMGESLRGCVRLCGGVVVVAVVEVAVVAVMAAMLVAANVATFVGGGTQAAVRLFVSGSAISAGNSGGSGGGGGVGAQHWV